MWRYSKLVYLRQMDETSTSALCKAVQTDCEWSHWVTGFDSFEDWLLQRITEESLGWNWIRGVLSAQGEVIGFVTAQWIDDSFFETETRVLECGTYLVPNCRGKGLNADVKAQTIRFAKEDLHAHFVVYAVPSTNLPAISSLRMQFQRLQYDTVPYDEIPYDTASLGASFTKWRRYQEWKHGTRMELFVIPLQ